MSPWGNFFAVIGVQLVFLIFIAYRQGSLKSITPLFILKGVIAGLVFGSAFDLVVGKYFGVCTYALGFTPQFLIVNDVLSYGLWILTLQLLRSERLLSFGSWTIAIGVVYEIANHFYPVWSWTFGGSYWYQEIAAILILYCGGALFLAFIASQFTKIKFRAFAPKK